MLIRHITIQPEPDAIAGGLCILLRTATLPYFDSENKSETEIATK